MNTNEEGLKEEYISWFSDVGKDDVNLVGGKGANLGEMTKEGMPVPPGFIVNAKSYEYFLEKTGIKEEIYEILKDLDVEDTSKLNEATKKIRGMIIKEKFPDDLKEEILEAYEILSFDDKEVKNKNKVAFDILKTTYEPTFVAIRSSATAEDSEAASFAGQQDTYLNVKGKEELIKNIKKNFASLFTSRSVYYRVKKEIEHEKVSNATVVQKMIDSKKSGVIFSRDPVTQEDRVIIEAVFGLGEGIVSGKIKPDNYIVSRDLKILDKKIVKKKIAITRDSSGKNNTVKLTPEKSKQQVLSNYEIKRLADLAVQLEEHYDKPQDIEFAIDEEIYIVQTRPVTTLEKKERKKEIKGKEILSGLGSSPGVGVGKVKIVKDLDDLSKIKKGDILVTGMTNPDMVVAMQKSSAIVTDEGGMTAHASIVSREMGIPCVVGTDEATKKLEEGKIITVDGYNGKVYAGKSQDSKKAEVKPVISTNINLKVIVDLPSVAERAAKTGLREVGLLRLEGIIAESGKHPLLFSEKNNLDKYEEVIYKGVKDISEYFDKLWVRTSDIRSDEYENLEGAPKEEEGNPMLGMHGVRAGLKFGFLKAEIKALMKIKNKEIGIFLPQIISVEEVRKVKKIMEELNADLELGVMIETPASVQIIEELCDEGIDFVSFGTNDLTQYTLAIDRNNEDVQYLYDELHPAVLSQIKDVIKVCKEKEVEISICGQAGSKEEMVKFLLEKGIDSISVNADKARDISELVRRVEEGRREEVEDKEKKVKEEIVEKREEKREESEEAEKDTEEEEAEETTEKREDEKEQEKKEQSGEEGKVEKKEEQREETGEQEKSEEEKREDEKEQSGEEGKVEKKKLKEEEEEEKKKDYKGKDTGEQDEFGRELYLVECSRCGNKSKVPFKPDPNKPVYCKDCYKKIQKEEQKEEEMTKGKEGEKQEQEEKEEKINETGEEGGEGEGKEEQREKKREQEREKEQEEKEDKGKEEKRKKEEEGVEEERVEEKEKEVEEVKEKMAQDFERIFKGNKIFYKIKCPECGKRKEVPVMPKPGKIIYCQDCYKKKNKNNGEEKENREQEKESKEVNLEDKEKEELVKEYDKQMKEKVEELEGEDKEETEEDYEDNGELGEVESLIKDREEDKEEKMREGIGENSEDILDIF